MKIIVVGAGISGLSTAWSLTRRGHVVTLVEQGPIPNPLAASGDHHRIIRRAYPAGSGYGRAITEAYEAWNELWGDLGVEHHDPRGFVCVSREAGDDAEDYRKGLEEGGFPFELHEPDEAVRRWPFLAREGMRYAYFSTEGGALHCRRIAAGIAAWLRENSADVRENIKVEAVDTDTASVRLGGGETLSADMVVVTAGAWVSKLFPDIRRDLTIHRTALAYATPPADLAEAWARAPVILDVGGRIDGYVIPPTGGAGLKFGTGRHKRRSDDADADRVAGPEEGPAILSHFSQAFARLGEYRIDQVVSCAYTFTKDDRFFAERRENALIVSACSGHGYKFGAAVGRRVADWCEDLDMAKLTAWLRAETV
ncbi:MAG: FAD-dependent oxidoreductase [Rhizobiaceae bacterium]|nr:FAD-dependent oxidoreductase [Rhizobiaceae bacterium]MCV0408823.1 FAD-dependent oxidoreductase [Rhizobiaceae bacterium]